MRTHIFQPLDILSDDHSRENGDPTRLGDPEYDDEDDLPGDEDRDGPSGRDRSRPILPQSSD